MRNAFAREITRLAQADERVVLLSGDIGNRLFDEMKARCPGRFFNCGVAEANMVGMAAGMALSGLRPVCYTIAPFLTYRCMEQIRVDLCYHNAPVVLVGAGGGLAYASLGATHHSCEELGMLRLLPDMTLIAPGDPHEVRAALAASLRHPGPVYIRIGKKGEPAVHAAPPEFVIGKGIPLRSGSDAHLLSSGATLPIAVAAVERLAARGVSAGLTSMPTLKPLDEERLARVFNEAKVVATVEEHSTLGGLGGAVAEWASSQPALKARLARFGARDEFIHETCEQESARERFGLTPEAIADAIQKALA